VEGSYSACDSQSQRPAGVVLIWVTVTSSQSMWHHLSQSDGWRDPVIGYQVLPSLQLHGYCQTPGVDSRDYGLYSVNTCSVLSWCVWKAAFQVAVASASSFLYTWPGGAVYCTCMSAVCCPTFWSISHCCSKFCTVHNCRCRCSCLSEKFWCWPPDKPVNV